MNNSEKLILDLCGGTSAWSKPYADNGYHVINITLPDYDVREYVPPQDIPVYGILAAPPCNCFARVAARWWKQQDVEGKTARAIEVFKVCWRLCQEAKVFWALENPPSRHFTLMPELDRPSWQFQPYHYGDPWVKQTYLWGKFNMPFPTNLVKPLPTKRAPSGHTQGRIAYLSGGDIRRSMTPPGFAKAFYEANK